MVSVCIATHNGAKFLKQQLESIIPQIGALDEIVISDDGSTDNTLKIINNISDKRIKVFRFHQPLNPLKGTQRSLLFASRNFENALKNANGEYIILCDQDDIWYPDKIDQVMRVLREVDICKHDFTIINEYGEYKKEGYYNRFYQSKRNWYYLIKALPFRGCCIAFRRSVLDAAFPFPQKCLQHDSWIGLVAKMINAKFEYIDKPLIYHRLHSMNASESKKQNSLYYKIKYRSLIICQLLIHKLKYLT